MSRPGGEPGRGSSPAPGATAWYPAGWLYPWQRYVALFWHRFLRTAAQSADPGGRVGARVPGVIEATGVPGGSAATGGAAGSGELGASLSKGPYRPLCRTRACHYNRDWTCCYDRVEPSPVAVMEASVCPHALFLHPDEP